MDHQNQNGWTIFIQEPQRNKAKKKKKEKKKIHKKSAFLFKLLH